MHIHTYFLHHAVSAILTHSIHSTEAMDPDCLAPYMNLCPSVAPVSTSPLALLHAYAKYTVWCQFLHAEDVSRTLIHS